MTRSTLLAVLVMAAVTTPAGAALVIDLPEEVVVADGVNPTTGYIEVRLTLTGAELKMSQKMQENRQTLDAAAGRSGYNRGGSPCRPNDTRQLDSLTATLATGNSATYLTR